MLWEGRCLAQQLAPLCPKYCGVMPPMKRRKRTIGFGTTRLCRLLNSDFGGVIFRLRDGSAQIAFRVFKRPLDCLCLLPFLFCFLQICGQRWTQALRGVPVCRGPASCRASTAPLPPDQYERGAPVDAPKWPSGCSSWILDCARFFFSLYKLLVVPPPAPRVGPCPPDAEAGRAQLNGASAKPGARRKKGSA